LRFFDALASALAIAIYNARLVADALEKERLKELLSIARGIQTGLFPADPKGIPGFDIAGFWMACEETAGDYYDFIPLSDDRLGLVMGDVSGHGVGPALLMTSARSLIRALCEEESFDVADVVRRMNERFVLDVKDGMFMTFFFAVLDPKESSLVYVNAGQTPPMLLRLNGGCEDFRTTGLALGIDSGIEYEEASPIQLRQGDVLALFSDGIVEARGPKGEIFGRQRLAEVLSKSRTCSSRDILEHVKESVRTHLRGLPVADDLSLAIVKAC
jgi:sigma-B regulation protein RsbU (phosphoserine phosphatase)